jgi:predicted RNA-binding Zn-ribbon protein involved in translation (DUF1610 family)
MKRATPIHRILAPRKEGVSRGDVKVIKLRNGAEYFLCPNCGEKTFFNRKDHKDFWCKKCGVFGVSIGYGNLYRILGSYGVKR